MLLSGSFLKLPVAVCAQSAGTAVMSAAVITLPSNN